MKLPELETSRLRIRRFVRDDLEQVHRVLNAAWGEDVSLAERREWLEWSIRNYERLEALIQPPYGDRAVELRATGEVVGVVGYVPVLNAFPQMPSFGSRSRQLGLTSPQFGLYWAIDPAHQGKGYATEAAQALVDFAFESLRLERIVATTEHENLASQAVMRKLGMRIETNPYPDPPYLEVVGVLEHPALR